MQLWPFRRTRSSSGPAPALATTTSRSQELLIICHGGDPSQAILENICRALDFAKIRFSILDLQRRSAWPALDSFSSIILCTELIGELGPEKTLELTAFVRSGGGMVVAHRCWNTQFSELFGLGANATEPSMHVTTGLSFEADVFAGSVGLVTAHPVTRLEHSVI